MNWLALRAMENLARFPILVKGFCALRRYWARAYALLHPENTRRRESEFEAFTTHYYRTPAPEKALRMLEYHLANEFSKDPADRFLMAFIFGRIARGNPVVLRGYEKLLPKASHERRSVILQALGVGGDQETREFLKARLNDAEFNIEKDEIGKLLERSVPFEVLERPIERGFDLDLLWAEFIVTGNTQAVSRIIEVLEWPDRIRDRLQLWMQSTSPQPQQAQLLEQVGIVLDYAEREIVNAEDLDMFSMLEQTSISMSRERFQKVKNALPFPLSEQDVNYIAVKSSAKWSLASKAGQHPLVLQGCSSEANKRTGRAKLALLEIAIRTYLAQGDLAAGFNHYDSFRRLKYDLQNPQLSAAEEELRALRGLSPNTASPEPSEVPNPRQIARRCAEETEKACSYLTHRIIIDRSLDYLKPKDYVLMEWQAQFVEPDGFHVTQVAREPDGSEPCDEWITIGLEHYDYIGYWFRPKEKATRMGLNHTMGQEQYLRILRTDQPSSVLLYHHRDKPYVLLQHEIRDEQCFPGLADEAEGPVHVRFWIEANSELLAKVEMVIQPKDPAKKGAPLELVHTFAGYGLKLRIRPPESWMVQGG